MHLTGQKTYLLLSLQVRDLYKKRLCLDSDCSKWHYKVDPAGEPWSKTHLQIWAKFYSGNYETGTSTPASCVTTQKLLPSPITKTRQKQSNAMTATRPYAPAKITLVTRIAPKILTPKTIPRTMDQNEIIREGSGRSTKIPNWFRAARTDDRLSINKGNPKESGSTQSEHILT